MRAFLGTIAVSTLVLSGCGDERVDRSGDDQRTASGEVRGGTISDAMLPLDTIQSQSPPLRIEANDTGAGEASDTADRQDESGDGTGSEAQAEPPAQPATETGED